MGQMIFCKGEGCPIKNLCARNTRVPTKPSERYEVFMGVPFEGEECKPYGCRFYWPEAHVGMTDVPVDPSEVLTMGGVEKDHGLVSENVAKTAPDPVDIEVEKLEIEAEEIHPDFAKALAAIPKNEPDMSGLIDEDAIEDLRGSRDEEPKTPLTAESFKPDPKPTIHIQAPLEIQQPDYKYQDTDIGGGGSAINNPAILWPTAEEQKDVFDMLCRTEGDIDAFDEISKKNRSTNPRDVWLVLDTIRTRMKKLIYAK